jgi:formylglycine-generating enzyme required for sulfatase activity
MMKRWHGMGHWAGKGVREACVLAGMVVSIAACKVADESLLGVTQIRVHLKTDVSYEMGRQLAITAAGPQDVDLAPVDADVEQPWDEKGEIGTVVVVPDGGRTGRAGGEFVVVVAEGDRNARVGIRIVMGVARAATSCSSNDTKGCIVARRRLQFIEHRALFLPIGLYAICEGVRCEPGTTCNALGKCVPSEVDGSKCGEADSEECMIGGESKLPTATIPDGGGSAGTAGSGGAGGSGGTSGTGGTGGSGGSDAGTGGTGGTGGTQYGNPGPSCTGMSGTACQGESCCSSILVPGGTFPMGRSESGTDAYSGGLASEQPEHNATVADFYLDEYEVTVGRFRKFVQQYDGTPPVAGAGAHPLIGGSGWQGGWNGNLPSSQAGLISSIKCSSTYQTWRDTTSGTEQLPMNCVSWYESFAFCAWDGGRLPTEAEWEYAAAGGSENRLYPWGSQAPSNSLAVYDCGYDGSSGCAFTDIGSVGSLPAGASRWGHKDLAGNMWEWALDWYDGSWYAGAGNACNNCAHITNASFRVFRGGHFGDYGSEVRAARRNYYYPTYRLNAIGFRCARTP